MDDGWQMTDDGLRAISIVPYVLGKHTHTETVIPKKEGPKLRSEVSDLIRTINEESSSWGSPHMSNSDSSVQESPFAGTIVDSSNAAD